MFQEMRKKSGSWIISGMFFMIILTFVLGFGVDPQGCASESKDIAVVNGESIPMSEYRSAYNNMLDYFQRMGLNDEMMKKLGQDPAKKALEQLIATMLLSQEAERLGFFVSEKEVAESIVETPYFHTNGKFDKELYTKIVLYQMNSTIKQYETKVKRELLANKLKSYFDASVDISNKELEEEYIKENEKVSLEYVEFSSETLKEDAKTKMKTTIDENAAKDFAAKNEARVKAYYEDHKDKFVADEKVKASHILVKVDEKMKDEDAKKKAEDVLKQVKEGKDFAELAKSFSDDGSAAQGGDLGFFGKGQMVPEFEKVAFTLKKDEVSELVKTQFGYHIIKVTDKTEKSEIAFEQAKADIAKTLMLEEKMKTMYEAEANKALSLLKNTAYKSEDLSKDMADWNVEMKEAKDVKKSARFVPGLGMSDSFMTKLFAEKNIPAFIGEVIKVDGKAFVVKIKEHLPADIKKFEEENSGLRDKLKMAKVQGVFSAYLKNLEKNASITRHEFSKKSEEE